MNRKAINIILVGAVILIWGIVLYKFLAPFFMPATPIVTAENLLPEPIKINRNKDTVNLIFPERDPFLGKVKVDNRAIVTNPKRERVRNVRTLKPVIWPKLEYLGFIKSNKSEGRLGLLRVDGALQRIYKNSEVNGLKVVRIDEDEILLKLGNEEKRIQKR